ncbi:MAG: hypothetical protein EOO46_23480 [Flavobacterium sp.]|nr:MAG: hypothetical protein EOO46_23480 [Flavobacterium sp.]
MKIFFYFLLFGTMNAVCQNTDLKQFIEWQQKSYKTVDRSLEQRYGWKKFNRSTSSTCIKYEYVLYKGLLKQQIITLAYTEDYALENNIFSYNAARDWKYDRLISELKSFGYKKIKSSKIKDAALDYYQLSDTIVIVSIYIGKDGLFKGTDMFSVYVGRDDQGYLKKDKI